MIQDEDGMSVRNRGQRSLRREMDRLVGHIWFVVGGLSAVAMRQGEGRVGGDNPFRH